ncbi:uncharacterized protein LOC125241105 [Leguminivora glycinivorella]|uniref:uncharacterized protein LOC125241105 n=1 Tax=Leguminivora glycinivorella TaxID=1035111 RepID=UPI00200C56A1|nr:uncharacterized protein LOC125241105 [Leguminivora glycinivorella]
MAVKITTAFIWILPVTLAQNGYMGYNYGAPVLRPNNVQQPYYNNVPELHNGFLPSPVHHYNAEVYRNQLVRNQHVINYNNQGYHGVQSMNENGNSFTPSISNGNSLEAQNLQANVQDKTFHNPSYTNTQDQQSVITKHIYFHLPPDDSDYVAPVTPSPPKKTYNIIFIKLPSQKLTSAVRLQQIVYQQAAESKTLIYVLVKKPETQTVQPVTSKPEVFYVKYKEPRHVAEPVQNGVVELRVSQNDIPGLLPGQINGHGV